MYREIYFEVRGPKDLFWVTDKYTEEELDIIKRFFNDYLEHGGKDLDVCDLTVIDLDENDPEDRGYLKDLGLL